MTRPEQPEPNHRFKTMQSLTTPSGNTFEYCIDSDESDCEVTLTIDLFIKERMEYLSILEDMYCIK